MLLQPERSPLGPGALDWDTRGIVEARFRKVEQCERIPQKHLLSNPFRHTARLPGQRQKGD